MCEVTWDVDSDQCYGSRGHSAGDTPSTGKHNITQSYQSNNKNIQPMPNNTSCINYQVYDTYTEL